MFKRNRIVPNIEDILQTQYYPVTFSSLETLMRAVGLEETLQGSRPVTLFAPTDGAFNQLHQETVYDLLKDITRLKRLLCYHIVPLALTIEEMKTLASPLTDPLAAGIERETARREDERILEVPTISDEVLVVTISNEVRVQGVPVSQANIEAKNGIMHVIERILWPPGMSEESFGERSPLSVRRPEEVQDW